MENQFKWAVAGWRLQEWTERFLTTLKLARLSLQNKFRDEEVIQEDCFVVHVMENDEAIATSDTFRHLLYDLRWQWWRCTITYAV